MNEINGIPVCDQIYGKRIFRVLRRISGTVVQGDHDAVSPDGFHGYVELIRNLPLKRMKYVCQM